MKKTRIAGAMLATAVALAFTGSVVNAADAPGASPGANQVPRRERVQGAERLQDRDFLQRLQGQKFVQG